MSSRRTVVLGILVLGLLAPLSPRLFLAASDAASAERFSRWVGRELSLGALPEWVFLLSPFLILAMAAFFALREPVDPRQRAGRARALWVTAIVAFGLGIWLCWPIAGQGMSFYIGESVFPFVAVPAMGFAYPLAYRVCGHHPRPAGSEGAGNGL